jgi:hypothetical protein
MERQFPAGLSAEQRSALCDFYAGRISAGQLTLRLGIEAPPPRDPPAERHRPASEGDREAPREQPGSKPFPARHRPAGSREPARLVD